MERYRRGVIVFAFVMSLAMVAVMAVDYVHAAKFGNYFGVYWRTANHRDLAYAPVWKYPFPYAPTMFLWISPLGFVAMWPAFILFCVASCAAFVAAVRPYL